LTKSRGFALLIVLFGLTTLTALYAVSTHLTMSNVNKNAGDASLAFSSEIRRSILRSTELFLPKSASVSIVELENQTVEIRPVTGLIDLNSSSRALLELFFDALGLEHTQRQKVYAWRGTGRRFLRVEDFMRIAEFTPTATTPPLHRLSTVFSGRPGISPDAATDELLAYMGWSAVPEPFYSPEASSNYLVFISGSTGQIYAGTVSAGGKNVRILEAR
jgi:hypothetical protein